MYKPLLQLKQFFLLVFIVAIGQSSFAQASGYSFSQGTQAYVPLGAGATAASDLLADSGEEDIAIGFDFEFEGVLYDSLSVTSDGFISFQLGASSTSSNNLDNGSASRRPLIAPLWDDHDGNANASAARYEVSGTAPNRVFTFEWSNWEWSWNASDSVVSFQVKLFETTNEIEFHYNWECASCITSPDASIGLSGLSSFLSVTGVGTGTVTASSSTEDSSLDTVVAGDVYTFTPPACVAPIPGSVTTVGTNTATINWSNAGSLNYEISYDVTGFTAGAPSANSATVTDTFFNATGLSQGTTYDFYIRQDCGGGVYSAWVGPLTATTVFGLPYFENFNNGYPAQGFTEAVGVIANPTVFTGTSSNWTQDDFANSGTDISAKSNIYTGFFGGTEDWMITPSINLGTTAAQLEFDMALTPFFSTGSSTLGADDTVKVVISTDNGQTWNDSNTVLTLHSGTPISGSGEHRIIDISQYSGIIQIGFYTESGTNNIDNDFFIDDIEVRAIPPCPEPTQFTVTGATQTSIDVSWSSNGSGPWYLIWGPCGFDQATNTLGRDTLTSASASITGLMTNTEYEFYLVEDCGVDGLSDTLNPACVATACGVYALPFTEGFNTTSSSERCWTVLDQNGDGDAFDLNETSNVLEGDEAASINTDFNAGSNNDWLISPAIVLSGNDRLKYSYRVRSSTEPNDWMILISTTGTQPSDFTDTLMPLAAYSNTSYEQQIIDLSAYNDTAYIAWHIPAGGLDGWVAYFDEIIVENIPPCVAPTQFSVTAATVDSISLSWIPGSAGTSSHTLEYGPAGFTPGGGTFITTTDTFVNVTGLTSNTAYDFYILDSCTNTASSTVGPLTASTFCSAVAMPYLEDFDVWPLNCWDTTLSTGFDWVQYTTTAGDIYAEAAFWSNSTGKAVIGSRPVTISQDALVKIDWSHSYSTSYPDDQFIIRARALGTTLWDTILDLKGPTFNDASAGNTSPGTFVTEEILLDPTLFTNKDVVFELIGVTDWGPDLFINDFEVVAAPTCIRPQNLRDTNTVAFETTLKWDDGLGTATDFEVWFGPQAFFQGTTTVGGTRAFTSFDSLYIDTLRDDFCYEFLVRSICGAGDTTDWAGPVVFCVPASCPAPTASGVVEGTTTINSADIWWTGGGASDFNVEYGPVGFTSGTGTMVNSTNDTLSLTGLSAGTGYEFYVRDSCAVGDVSTWFGPAAFVTAYTTNYLETFNNSTFSSPIWTQATGRLTSSTTFSSNSSSWGFDDFGNDGGNSTSQRVNLWTTNQFYWLISPSIYLDPAKTNLQVELDAAVTQYINTNQGYFANDDTLALVISTDNGASWSSSNIIWAQTDNDTVDAAGEHFIIPLTGYSGYVKFGLYGASSVGGGADNDVFVDNFEVREPAACARPSNLAVSQIKTDSAYVSWTAGEPTAIDWSVILVQGNQPASSGTVYTASNSNYWLNGLSSGTEYCYYLVEQCTAGYSDTLGPVCFTTECTPFVAPYSQNFDGADWVADNVGFSAEASEIGNCWTATPGVDQGYGFRVRSNATGSSLTGPNQDTTGGNFLYTEASDGVSGDTAYLVSPLIDLSGLSNPELSFAYHFYGADIDQMDVEIGVNGNYTILTNLSGSVQGSSNDPWKYEVSDLSAYVGQTITVRFTAIRGADFEGDMAIDDFRVDDNNCPAPNALALDAANCDSLTVSWSSNSGSSLIQYGPAGFTPGTGTFVANVTSPYTITGLSQNTDYDIWVADTCGMDTSGFFGPVTVTTDSLAPLMASFTANQVDTTASDARVAVNASASTGDGLSYSWSFGGNAMMNDTAVYQSNGSYSITLTVTDRCGNTDDTTVTITVGGISIVENQFNASLELFPNPSTGQFSVEVSNGNGEYKVTMTDLRGREIMTSEGLHYGTTHRLEAENAASGVYLIHFSGEGLNMTKRLVIK